MYVRDVSPRFQSTLPVWGGTRTLITLWYQDRHFNPPSPCGEGPFCNRKCTCFGNFNPPSPCGEGPISAAPRPQRMRISIHPPRVGRDEKPRLCRLLHPDFNPPSPCGEGLQKSCQRVCQGYFNPPSPCGEGPVAHPLTPIRGSDFNPPSPCGEGQIASAVNEILAGFQSTLPVWGGTRTNERPTATAIDFNPPSPCGEGLDDIDLSDVQADISIHPPRVGRDWMRFGIARARSISIHPPRVGRDRSR